MKSQFEQHGLLVRCLLCAVVIVVTAHSHLSSAQENTARYIVRFKGRSAAAASAAGHDGQLRQTEAAYGMPVLSILPHDGAVVTMLSEATAQELAARSDVESVEVDVPMRAFRTTNDSLLSQLYGLDATPGINAFSAWDKSIGSSKALVAVLDSGVDDRHPDLANAIWRNPKEIPNNGRDDDRNGYVDDYRGYDFVNKDNSPRDDQGHGSHVAGIIAATGDNNQGVVGVAWGSKIIPLKVLDRSGNGYTSDIVAGMDYAGDLRKRGVPVVVLNMSLGGETSPALERAVKRTLINGLLIVAAAGNESSNNDFVRIYPAGFALPNIVAVSAVDAAGNLSEYSNYGATTVSLSAPGDDIISTVPHSIVGSYYLARSGTSMATPYASGVAALVAAKNLRLTAPLIKNVLMSSVHTAPALAGLSVSGGYLDANAAVTLAPLQATKFRISGSVRTRQGQGIQGIVITLQAPGKRVQRLVTAADGTFGRGGLPAATYTVRATKRGRSFSPSQKIFPLYADRELVFRATR